jgi:hypothetical protein
MVKKTKPAAATVAGQSGLPVLPASVEVIHRGSDVHEQRADTMDVVLAEGERRMTEAMDAAVTRHKELAKEEDALGETIARALQARAAEVGAQALRLFRESEIAAFLQIPQKKLVMTANGAAPVQRNNRWLPMRVTIAITAEGNQVIARTISVKAPSAVLVDMKRRQKLCARKEAAQQEALGWKRKLAQMGRLERSTRAALAADRIRSTKDGAKTLDALLGGLDAAIDALPTG